MRMQSQLLLAAGVFGLALGPAGAHAQVEFPVPRNSLALEETGTLEGMQGNLVKFRDSKKDTWLLQVLPQTTVSVEGEADADYLRRGMTIELTGTVNEDSTLAEPVGEIEVLSSKGRPSLGFFSADDDKDTRPVRNPEAGKYRIRGKLASYKDGELLVAVGRLKITGKTGQEVKVKLTLDDARNAKFGDTVKVKAWYYDQTKPNPALNLPGKALAETLSITLSEPPGAKRR
jgi:hypothetical protein